MPDYKSIRFTVDLEADDKVLAVVNSYLAQQPNPRPFVEANSSRGYVFYFHTLSLLQKPTAECRVFHYYLAIKRPFCSGVIESFNGVGTTTAVAQRLGRRFVGIDISQEYCDIAQKRLVSTLF